MMSAGMSMRERLARSSSPTSISPSLIALVQIEINEGRGAELHRRESLIEIARGDNARQHVLRQGFARLGMERETAQHAGLQQPMLIKLRGKLDEIARDIRARDARISDVGQHAMQRMAELVEQCVRVVEADQLRRAGRAFREIHHIDDDGADIAGKFFLAAELRHPGAAALGGPREIIAEKQRHMFAPLVQDFERAHFRMIKIEPAPLDKPQPEETLGHMEGGGDHIVELEIGRDLGRIEIVTLLARALGVIAPVGGGELKIRALFFDGRLQRGALAPRLFERRRPDLIEKGAHGVGRFRHRVVELVGGEILVAEQPRAFVAQSQDFSDDGAIVRLPAVLAPASPKR